MKNFKFDKEIDYLYITSDNGNDTSVFLQGLTSEQRNKIELQLELIVVDIINSLNRKHYIEESLKKINSGYYVDD